MKLQQDIIPKFFVKIFDDDPISWNIDDLTMTEGDENTVMPFNVHYETPRPLDLGSTSVTWTASTELGDTCKPSVKITLQNIIYILLSLEYVEEPIPTFLPF